MVKYTKRHYLAKIEALEGYFDMLRDHEKILEDYREQINTFWKDDNAKLAYQTLGKKCRHLKNAEDRLRSQIIALKKSVEKIGAIEDFVNSGLELAKSILGGL